MSDAVTYELENRRVSPRSAGAWATGLVLLAWLALVASLGAANAFATPAGEPPLVLLIAVAGPVIAFLIVKRLSHRFREGVFAVNLPLITAIQAWRFAGFGFLALWAQGLLPGYFAWPAGLGDMAIAFFAPWMALALVHGPGSAADRTFVAWNVLGILDLVVAVSLGAVVPLVLGPAPGSVDLGIMARLPMVLIPAYLVPGFIILHLTALAQSRGHRPRQ